MIVRETGYLVGDERTKVDATGGWSDSYNIGFRGERTCSVDSSREGRTTLMKA